MAPTGMYGTLINGTPYESSIPFLLPFRVEMEDLSPSIYNDDDRTYFTENYYLCVCEITIHGIKGEISETEGAWLRASNSKRTYRLRVRRRIL